MNGTDWATIRPALKAIIVSVVPEQTANVVWEDQPDQYVDPQLRAIIRLNIGTPQDIGDEIRTFYNGAAAPDPSMQDTVVTWQKFTFKVKCEAYSQVDGDGAVAILTSIRNRLSRRGVLDALNATHCALIGCAPIVDLGDLADDRRRSVGALDIRLALCTQELDPVLYPNVQTFSVTKVP